MITFSILKLDGNFDNISVASSSITCCEDFPAPPVILGNVNRIFSNNYNQINFAFNNKFIFYL